MSLVQKRGCEFVENMIKYITACKMLHGHICLPGIDLSELVLTKESLAEFKLLFSSSKLKITIICRVLSGSQLN
jgi:hypothetical protein